MVVPHSRPDPYDEGYPPSNAADLDPGPDLSESLDYADRVAGDEHRVVMEGRQLDRLTDDDRYEDVDDSESRH
jgi:hypothetical protein